MLTTLHGHLSNTGARKQDWWTSEFHHGSIAIDTIPVYYSSVRRARRSHSPHTQCPPAVLTTGNYFSLPKTIKDCNNLTEDVAAAPTIVIFRSCLPNQHPPFPLECTLPLRKVKVCWVLGLLPTILFWTEFFQYPDAFKTWGGVGKRIHNKITLYILSLMCQPDIRGHKASHHHPNHPAYVLSFPFLQTCDLTITQSAVCLYFVIFNL